MANRAVFFDRDGTLVEAVLRPGFEKGITAPFSLSEVKFYPRVFHVLNELRRRRIKVIMITNQPDVAYGYLSEEDWQKVLDRIVGQLQFRPDEVYLCRHRTDDKCGLKKPSGLMLQAAACRHNIDLQSSFMVGDTVSDTGAGKNAGCKTILIRRPYNGEVEADFIIDDIAEVLEIVGL